MFIVGCNINHRKKKLLSFFSRFDLLTNNNGSSRHENIFIEGLHITILEFIVQVNTEQQIFL